MNLPNLRWTSIPTSRPTAVLPVNETIAAFHPNTAHGKLNAEITPTNPSGFHFSKIRCLPRSEGNN
uniref:CSON007394 protein n=1 Tax=Culicoides sonorensis TaxID=179676 RepID=A0A336LKE5_CULSO